jgi:hypothetical protein
LEAELARRVNDMLEQRLHPVHRAMWLASGLAGIASAGLLGYVASSWRGSVPWQATAGLAAGAIFGIAWAAIAYSIVRRGKIIRNLHPSQIAGWVWAVALVQFIVFSVVAPQAKHHYVATVGMIDSIGYLVLGAAWLVTNLVSQASLRSEEQFLKLQLQLADMAARLRSLEQGKGSK